MRRSRIIWFCLWVLSVVGISLKGGTVTYGFFTLLTLAPFLSLFICWQSICCFIFIRNSKTDLSP